MSEITIRFGSYEATSTVRQTVFIAEQGFENEFDDIDARAEHVGLFVDDLCVSVARTFADAKNPGIWYLGRVATLKPYRGYGYAHRVCQACEDFVRKQPGAQELRAHVQARLAPWYATLGFVQIDEVDFEDEGQPHIWMTKYL